MWNRKEINQNISKKLPSDVRISKISFFPSRKVIVFGYCHISRLSQLNRLQRTLSNKSGWKINFNMIGITGRIINSQIEAILDVFLQKYDIKFIHVDLDVKFIGIELDINAPITESMLVPLINLQKELGFQIRLKHLKEDKFRSVSSYREEVKNSDNLFYF